jgi:SAM-dependent methyltransferase
MKRVERCSLDSTKYNNKFVISEHLAHYRLILPRLSGKVLDAGSGEGYGVDMMRKSGLDAYGIDLSPEVVQRTCEKYGPYYKPGSIMQIPHPDQSFDAVTCMEVIEHVSESDASKALTEIRRVLKTGGELILSTPNVRNSTGSVVNDYHLKEYTSTEMTAKLEQAGYGDVTFFGLVCSNPAVKGMANSGVAQSWMKIKHMIGLNRPLGNLGHIMEKVLTGHTTKDILEEDCWSIEPNDESTLTMVFTAKRVG